MIKLLIQAIKMAPRFLWQIYAQPSKVYDLVNEGKEDKEKLYLATFAFFFSGLLVGIVMAVPHFLLYGDLSRSLLFALGFGVAFSYSFAFAFAGAGAGAVAFAFAGAGAVAGAFAFAFAGAGAVAFAGAGAVAVAFAFAFAGAVAFAFAFAFALALAVAFAFAGVAEKSAIGKSIAVFPAQPFSTILFGLLFVFFLWLLYLVFKRKIKSKSGHLWAPAIFVFSVIFLSLAGEGGGGGPFEAILYPFSYMGGIIIVFNFFYRLKSHLYQGIPGQLKKGYARFQRSAIFWGPIATLAIYIWAYFIDKINMDTSLHIIALSFLVIPLFIAHIPDFLVALPGWLSLRRKIVKDFERSEELLPEFEKSILFRHDPLYFQLPGLHKILISFVEDKSVGVRETAKQISRIYHSTYQQKQAQKAVAEIANNKTQTHHLFLSLLQLDGESLLKKVSRNNRVAKLYLMLFEKTGIATAKGAVATNLIGGRATDSLWARKEVIIESIPERFDDRIDYVVREMKKQEGYRLNEEIVQTLKTAHALLSSEMPKDIENACNILSEIKVFPEETAYFSFCKTAASQLAKVGDSLGKIASIERIESRRSILSDQRQHLRDLLEDVEKDLFEPFKGIWQKALNHGIEVIEKEIKVLRGSAALTIDLKNKEVLASNTEQNLYFEIHNKGVELASNILASVVVKGASISLVDSRTVEITVIEPGTRKEINFPIKTQMPGRTTIKGTITYSDPSREGKHLEFSFSVTVRERSVEFKEIINPYTIGQPLKGDAPHYFGREDAYKFIDKNITASGDSHTIVCHGLRRTGKTSILYHIESIGFTDKRLVPVNIDIQGIYDEKDFYHTISTEIKEKLSLSSGAPAKDFSQFKQFVKEIKPELGERIIVLMIDEFEELQLRVEEKKISRSIFSNIRHLMQHEEKLVFLFCGTHKLEEMSADYWSIFFNTAIYLRITHLKRKDAIRLIREPVKGQLDYDDLAVEQILKMTAGQPYLIQLICRSLVNELNETKKRNDALIDDVDDAVDYIITNDQDRFSQSIWQGANILERLALSSTAEELTHKQLDRVGLDAVLERVQTVTQKYSRKEVVEVLDRLTAKEVLVEKNQRYCFHINMLRKWIFAKYPLRKVREEIE